MLRCGHWRSQLCYWMVSNSFVFIYLYARWYVNTTSVNVHLPSGKKFVFKDDPVWWHRIWHIHVRHIMRAAIVSVWFRLTITLYNRFAILKMDGVCAQHGSYKVAVCCHYHTDNFNSYPVHILGNMHHQSSEWVNWMMYTPLAPLMDRTQTSGMHESDLWSDSYYIVVISPLHIHHQSAF